jgi:hypothetical protein
MNSRMSDNGDEAVTKDDEAITEDGFLSSPAKPIKTNEESYVSDDSDGSDAKKQTYSKGDFMQCPSCGAEGLHLTYCIQCEEFLA